MIEKLRNQLSEDVNVDKDGFRTYDSPEDSDIEEPYKPKKKLKILV